MVRSDVQTVSGEGAAEDEFARVLGDVDEATHAGETGAEAGNIDIPILIDLRGTEGGKVEATTVVKIELRRLIDDRLRKE